MMPVVKVRAPLKSVFKSRLLPSLIIATIPKLPSIAGMMKRSVFPSPAPACSAVPESSLAVNTDAWTSVSENVANKARNPAPSITLITGA